MLCQGEVEVATAVVSAAFTLLGLTGRIDPNGLRATLRALDALVDVVGPQPALEDMRRDLTALGSSA